MIEVLTAGELLLDETVQLGGPIQFTVTEAAVPVPPALIPLTEYVRAPAVVLVVVHVEVVELQPVQL